MDKKLVVNGSTKKHSSLSPLDDSWKILLESNPLQSFVAVLWDSSVQV